MRIHTGGKVCTYRRKSVLLVGTYVHTYTPTYMNSIKGLLTRITKSCCAMSHDTTRHTERIGYALVAQRRATWHNTNIIVCVNRLVH
jgi:hypothetical protein